MPRLQDAVPGDPQRTWQRHPNPVLIDLLHLAPESPEWIDFEEFETSDSVSETLPSDYFESIGLDYLASGQGQKGNVGASQSFLFDGPDFVRFAVNWLERSCRAGGNRLRRSQGQAFSMSRKRALIPAPVQRCGFRNPFRFQSTGR